MKQATPSGRVVAVSYYPTSQGIADPLPNPTSNLPPNLTSNLTPNLTSNLMPNPTNNLMPQLKPGIL